MIFGVDNSPQSNTDNCKSSFLVLGGGPTYDIYDSIHGIYAKFSINFSKAKAKVCLILH